jgi:hypothetical protein
VAGSGAGAAGVCVRRGQPARSGTASRDRHPGRSRRHRGRAGRGDGHVHRQGRRERAHDHHSDARRLRGHAAASRLVPGRHGRRRGRGAAGCARRDEWSAFPPGAVRAARGQARERSAGLPRPAELPAAACIAGARAERAACPLHGSRIAASYCSGGPAFVTACAGRNARRGGRVAAGAAAPASDTGCRATPKHSCPWRPARHAPGDRSPTGFDHIGPCSGRGGRPRAARRSPADRPATGARRARKAVAPRARPRARRRAGTAARTALPLEAGRRSDLAPPGCGCAGHPRPAQGRSYHWR